MKSPIFQTTGKRIAIASGCFLALCWLVTNSQGFAFNRRMLTRLCYTSPNVQQILSQCVLCDYYNFPTTMLGCTGSTALTSNMTSTQALCVINGCFAQVQQTPSFSGSPQFPQQQGLQGRKKREIDNSLETKTEEPEVEPEDYLEQDLQHFPKRIDSEKTAFENVKIIKDVFVEIGDEYSVYN